MQSILMQQTLAACKRTDVTRGIPASHPDVPETLLVESNPTVMHSRDAPEPGSLDGDTVSVVSDRQDRPDDEDEDADEAEETETDDATTVTDSPANGDPQHVLERFPTKWYTPDSNRYEYAVRTPDGDRDYRKTVEAAANLLTKYYAE